VGQISSRSQFCVIRQEGKVEQIAAGDVHPTSSFDQRGTLLAFVGESATDAPELWLSNGEAGPVKLTRFNESWSQIPLIKPELVNYKSFDGTQIEALLLKPRGYVEGTKVATVVLVHGGPTGVWSDSFEPWGLQGRNGWR
jgi:dipeptidyl aminopeptidase/acylaminoacyl peptidase